jgi:hypothetical protein
MYIFCQILPPQGKGSFTLVFWFRNCVEKCWFQTCESNSTSLLVGGVYTSGTSLLVGGVYTSGTSLLVGGVYMRGGFRGDSREIRVRLFLWKLFEPSVSVSLLCGTMMDGFGVHFSLHSNNMMILLFPILFVHPQLRYLVTSYICVCW